MNKLLIIFCTILFVSCKSSRKQKSTIATENFKIELGKVSKKSVFTDREDITVWGGSAIKGKDGLYHMFYSRWKKELGWAWVTHSEIAHAVSTSPFGPFEYKDVTLPLRGASYWDGLCTHNPTVHKFNGKYYLYYMGNTGDGVNPCVPGKIKYNWTHRNNQRIGVAVADDPNGPWKRFDSPLIDASKDENALDALLANNPSIAKGPNNTYVMVYKAVGKKIKRISGGPVVHCVATSNSPTGPFKKHDQPVFQAKGTDFPAEDPYIWFQEGKYRAIVKDMHGSFTKAGQALVLFESIDGFDWKLSKNPLVSKLEIQWEDGSIQKLKHLERPQIYSENGKPIALYCAADTIDAKGVLHSWNVQIPIKPYINNNQMKYKALLFLVVLSLFSCNKTQETRTILDFNFNWKFVKEDISNAKQFSFDDSSWESVNVPHDWTILAGYQKENTAASTGFTEGGIGWYRKTFKVPASDKGKIIWIEFDGIYNNSTVWINGHQLGFRPNGYSSFCYDLTKHLNYGKENVIAVKVDHTAYVDSRWYTGSGIYRDVRLVNTSKTHIPHWGVKITTPKVSPSEATVHLETQVKAETEVEVLIDILDENKNIVASNSETIASKKSVQDITIANPKLWGVEKGNLYTARVSIKENGTLVDQVEERFGIRSILFDPNKGFLLNGKQVKIKGVNLHHDVGAVGAAATKASWEYRIQKLKSIGVNAIRMAHNPHAPILMEVCDEQGMLVMNEFFDEWHHAKDKNVNCLGGSKAKGAIQKGYSDVFLDWAEKDLKDLIRRDFNHPSTIMWSIGNEIEWTFPYYSTAYDELNPKAVAYKTIPEFDAEKVKPVLNKHSGGIDSLAIIAKKLSKWVKEEDTTRPITCGSVRPSISIASGYGDAVDIMGFNYRANIYDIAHKTYPNKPIVGSENWVAYSEWKAVAERDFVAGIFMWTGFAYIGEAGPWPRKGLNISLFDFAGFKNPRGHFFECLWKPETPKVYMVTTPASESEFSYHEKEDWKFDIQYTAPPVWNKLRLWEWYKVNEHWNYKSDESIVVQTYTNCEEAELFLNGKSLGKQTLATVKESDHILKWLVPYTKGELKVVGYTNGKIADEYILATTDKVASIEITSNKNQLKSDTYDVAYVAIQLKDAHGNEIRNNESEVTFEVTGDADLKAVDNGWEMNVAPHNTNKVVTHKGRAIAIIKSTHKKGTAIIVAKTGNIKSKSFTLEFN